MSLSPDILPASPSNGHLLVPAVVVPRVTSDLALNPISLKSDWTHLKNISLPDPQFDTPGQIDLLLGVDVYVDSLLHGWWSGPPGSPVAYKTISLGLGRKDTL